MSNKIVVLGSNSFSGASFCRHLLSQGKEVIALSRSVEPIDALLPYKWQDKPLAFYQYDLNHNLADIEKLLAIEKPKHIYNFAAQSMVGQSWQHPEHWFMTNTVSTIQFHNMLRKVDWLDRYIHISTPEVYGSCSGYVQENKNYQPSTPYAVSRAAADMSLHTFNDVYDFPVSFTRATNVYGAGQQLYRIIPRAILAILQQGTLSLHGGGHSERSFIHIDDVSAATLAIGEKGNNGEIYHIATKDTVSIRGLVQQICKLMDYPFERLCEASEDRLGKDSAYLLDSSKVRNELAWQDNILLENGLKETIKWLTDNYQVLKIQPSEYIHKA
ncbi:dTDP-glucose 4,6-dehydratase [Colwellia sp. 39_35_sub15_T18]|nr:dTDP-glucose 4,6-dehydratase [Colwellia sp. 39_35_sub15_T18]